MNDNEPIEGTFALTAVEPQSPALNALAVTTASHWDDRQLTAPNTFIPIPEYLGADWRPAWDKVPPKTPKDEIREARNETTGLLMYKFVTTAYCVRVLDRIFKGHNWGIETIWEGRTHEKSTGEYEYVVVNQIVGPGMFRPVQGVGSSIYHPTNRQDTDAKTRAGAFTTAFKNAAKQLGIGRDLDEDDPAMIKLVDDRTRTISTMFDRLITMGYDKEVKAVVRRLAPTALLESGQLLTGQIDFEVLEPMQRELSQLATRLAQQKQASSTNGTQVEATTPA